ncbi:hypothetical protein H8959_021320, partial [Pygathrix nigripes]
FPPSSPLKPYPKKPPYQKDVIKFPEWNDPPPGTSQENIPVRPVVMNSEMWYKRHSIAIGEVPACRLVHRRQLTEANVEEIWKSMTLSYLQKILGLDSLEEVLDIKLVNSKFIIHNVYSVSKQGVVILDDKSKELPHWVLSAMKCLANWPNCSDLKQPMYLGFEKDVFKTIADYYGHLKEPLLTFHLFDAFVSVLGVEVSIPQAGLCKGAPGTQPRGTPASLPVVLGGQMSKALGAERFRGHGPLKQGPCWALQKAEIKYPGADMDITLSAPSFCRQISPEEFEYQRSYGSQEPLAALLEEVITDAKLSSKEKKKKLKQFQKSYPEVYQERFPTPESEALLFPEKPKPKPQLLMWALKKPFQPFQRTRSFRM